MPNLEDVRWASDDITLPNAGVANKLPPSAAIKDNGYDKGQKPTASVFNFWRNAVYDWIVDLDSRTTTGLDLARVYPVGSMYINTTNATNPGDVTMFGFGTWVQTGKGRVLIGEGTSSNDDNGVQRGFSIGDTGGEFDHTLTVSEMPSHSHSGNFWSSTKNEGSTIGPDLDPGDPDGIIDSVDSTGGGQSHNNVQPYLVVYMWVRTA